MSHLTVQQPKGKLLRSTDRLSHQHPGLRLLHHTGVSLCWFLVQLLARLPLFSLQWRVNGHTVHVMYAPPPHVRHIQVGLSVGPPGASDHVLRSKQSLLRLTHRHDNTQPRPSPPARLSAPSPPSKSSSKLGAVCHLAKKKASSFRNDRWQKSKGNEF